MLGALALLTVLDCAAAGQVADTDRPLDGEAYTAADQAYKAFDGRLSQTAAEAARSVALRPDILRLHFF